METRPNLILIVTDQQRFDTIHAAGNPSIFTPHLNWMMRTGVLFTRAYSDAPVCIPARATMLTGKSAYQFTKGFGELEETTAPDPSRTLPARLTAAGYQTRAVGKLHYTPERCNYGFEHAEILQDYYRERRKFGAPPPMDHGMGQNEMEPVISTVHESNSITHWIAERAVNFIETRDPTRPFFLNVGFSKPHPPFDPPLNYWTLYQNQPMPQPVRGDWSQKATDVPPGFIWPTWCLNGADRFSTEQWTAIRRAYYACITQIDYHLGLLFARLRELDLLDNTLIVFTSDHGEMLGDHHMGAKSTFFEGSCHVPLLVRPPRAAGDFAETTCDSITTHADLMTTFLTAAGVPLPDDLPKTSLDLVAACRGDVRRDTFFGAFQGQFGIIENEWKYLFSEVGGCELLFNLKKDPQERHDLAQTHPDKRDSLHRRLAKELAGHQHPDVNAVAGRLITKPVDAAFRARKLPWPGFHTPNHPPYEALH